MEGKSTHSRVWRRVQRAFALALLGTASYAIYAGVTTQPTPPPRISVHPLHRRILITNRPVGTLAVLLEQRDAPDAPPPFWYERPVVRQDGKYYLLSDSETQPPYTAEIIGRAESVADLLGVVNKAFSEQYKLSALEPRAHLQYDGQSLDGILEPHPPPPKPKPTFFQLLEQLANYMP